MKRKKYIVEVREIWVQPVRISAEDAAFALRRVLDGEGKLVENGLDYSSTLDPEKWTVRLETPSEAKKVEVIGDGK